MQKSYIWPVQYWYLKEVLCKPGMHVWTNESGAMIQEVTFNTTPSKSTGYQHVTPDGLRWPLYEASEDSGVVRSYH